MRAGRGGSTKRPVAGAAARAIAFLCLPLAGTLGAQSPAVREHRLDNGVVALLAPRPGCGAVHAAWFFGGGRAGAGAADDRAAEALLAAWFFGSDATAASGFWMKPVCGGVASGRDIMAEGLEEWCAAELRRATGPLGQGRFEGASKGRPGQDPLKELKAFALNPSARAAPSDVPPERLRALAEGSAAPEGALIVLVGDVEEGSAISALDAHFGRLPPSRTPPVGAADGERGRGGGGRGAKGEGGEEHGDGAPREPPMPTGKVIPSETETEALVAWKMRPLGARDPAGVPGRRDALDLFAELLAGSVDSALRSHMVGVLGCSGGVGASVEPLADRSSLFVVRADALDGHAPQEIAGAMHDQVLVALEKGWSGAEVDRAARRLEARRASRLADAAGLAAALIDAFAGAGDWRAALGHAPPNTRPNELAAALRPLFGPENALSLIAERDPIRSPKNQEHARLVSLLSQRLEKMGGEAGRREDLIREAVRQFGLMPAALRGSTLSVLEAEAAR